jgi:hypothetical protein
MSAKAGGGERRFVDSNLFLYAHDKSAGRKREVARDLYHGALGVEIGVRQRAGAPGTVRQPYS